MTPELHPLCTLFPRVEGTEFDSLVADIKANGLQQPIVLADGLVLDGGNRLRACHAAGVEPQFEQFEGPSIVAYVLTANLHRRHLSAGQRAAIVASAQDWANAQSVGKPKSGNVAGLHRVEDRAAQSGASERTQRMADKVAKADPKLAEQVGHGQVSLPKAVNSLTPRRGARKFGKEKKVPASKWLKAETKAAEAKHALDKLQEGIRDLRAAGEDEEDHGADFNPLAELESATTELTKLRKLLEADDKAAEALRWQDAYEVARRRSDEHLTTIKARDKQIAFLSRQLQRCGKAVGEADTDKIAPAVERVARAAKAAA